MTANRSSSCNLLRDLLFKQILTTLLHFYCYFISEAGSSSCVIVQGYTISLINLLQTEINYYDHASYSGICKTLFKNYEFSVR